MPVDPSAMTEAGGGAAQPGLVPGASIGKYRLDRVLGAGGMGVVWAAYDPDLERPVAIKLLRSIDSGATLRTRLLREARAMARLKHPNVLTVYEVGTDRNRDYIAMELIDGADLDGWLATKPPRAEIFAALLAAGRGLVAAHDAGLIHRDLKPHNILRGRDGSVYVTDFGLARGQIDDGAEVVQVPIERGPAGPAGRGAGGRDAAIAGNAATAPLAGHTAAGPAATALAGGSQPRGADSVLDSPLTQTGVLIGTPAYMAPEQFTGRAPDPRSDQFAFCVTAWEALTGARPFTGRNLEELRAAASAGVERLGAPETLPARVRGVLARGLAPDPAARWPNMHVVLREIEAAIAPPPRSRMPLYAGVGLAVVGFLVGVGLYTHSRTGGNNRSAVAGDCSSPTEAFGAAWSAERRKAVLGRHRADVQLIAVSAMLDSVRDEWFKLYESTCAMSPSATRHERLACLFEARDEVDEATEELTKEDSELSITGVIPLNVSVGACKH